MTTSTDRSALSPTERAAGLDLVQRALAEDLALGAGVDLTAAAVSGSSLHAQLVARQDGVVCGLALAVDTFTTCGAERVQQRVTDGSTVHAGEVLIDVTGDAAHILRAERTALNIVQRLAGTATLTRRYVDAVNATHAHVMDTRKTIPGMRALQRWAVRCGGGHNHRFGLSDEAMLKDNHLAVCGGIAPAVERIRTAHPDVRIHVEADTVEQAQAAAEAGADVVLLDNMTNGELHDAVTRIAGRALTEASGGITLDTIAAIAATGVDRISVGAITHSAPAFDAALDC